MRWILALVLCAASAAAQKYTGPQPPRADLPFLVHADNLEPTEDLVANEQERKDEILYTVKGASSPARTPLASPIFLLKAEKLDPSRLQLFKLDSRNGQREILFRKKKNNARPIRITVTRLSQDNLYRIEVDESLENGEYSLSPEGLNQVFCFQVY
ncbi:MAG: hypothetical protein ACE15B_25545 [Bryobacteraceae bacterium]